MFSAMGKQYDSRLSLDIPEKFHFLFKPKRYKVAKGGRSSGKSWSFARALVVTGYASPKRILCTREVQDSIDESVYQLLKDQIAALDLSWFYTIQRDRIIGQNGTLFVFEGLAQHTIHSLKSYEGFDIVWVEEAHAVSKRSWDVLIPTIRKEGSEIWVSFNPELETDETYKRFVTEADPEEYEVVHVDYRDNPFLTATSERSRIECLLKRPDDYDNIWLGLCRPAVAGAIYYKQVAEMERQGRICNVPYDPFLKVHLVVDIGYNDTQAIGFVQRRASEIRVIDYIEDNRRTWDSYSVEMKEKHYNWGRLWLPHDGFAGDMKSHGKSSADILHALGWDVPTRDEIVEASIEEGIRIARMTFPRVYIDKGCTRLVECLKRYRRHVSKQTGAETGPIHDEFSNGADMFRYLSLNVEQFSNEERGRMKYRAPNRGAAYSRPLDSGVGY